MKDISEDIKNILLKLESNKHEAFIVGGATRDYLLGRDIHDIDITTDASPDEIKDIFKDYTYYEIGKQLGTVTLVLGDEYVDITPYRKEGEYIKHRRPKSVTYSKELKEDLKRRDFTINALCMDYKGNITDLFNGIDDLNNKVIRAIGDPDVRFNEDALRILRAIRFNVTLGFKIEDKTEEALFRNKDLLKYISKERKRDELLKILDKPHTYKTLSRYEDIFKTFINFDNLNKKVDDFNNSYHKLAYLIDDISALKNISLSKKEMHLIKTLNSLNNLKIDDDYIFIKMLSNDSFKEDILSYLEALHNISLKDRYESLKDYIVTLKTLKIDGLSLKKLGYEGIYIKNIQEAIINEIQHQRLKNDLGAIRDYLNTK